MSSVWRASAPAPCSWAPASRRPPIRPPLWRRSPALHGHAVAVELKFCGLTRAEDTAVAVSLGAAYVGVIFADSPRRIEPPAATAVLVPARARAKTVGVFGPASIETVATV